MATTQPDLLVGITDEDAARVLALGSRTALSAGRALFKLGDIAQSLYVVERGRVALTLPMTVQGREQEVLVEERSAGQTLGWSALVPPHRFTLNAVASVETEVLALPRTALFDHFEAHPRVGCAVARNVSAVVGHRLQVVQTMWLREIQRVVEITGSRSSSPA
jgi:CRP-like cAMP-binding protein